MILFSESQKFRQLWIWIALLAAEGIMLWGVAQQIVFHHPFGSKPAPDGMLIAASLIPAAIIILFASIRLDTSVSGSDISYRFFPFHLKPRSIAWDTIANAYVRRYSPLSEYGGWGIRYGLGGKGKAFNISGNRGLQLVMKNGKKILIGTGRAEELDAVISQLASKGIVMSKAE